MPSLAGISFVTSWRMFSKGIDNQGPYFDMEYQIGDWSDSNAFANALMGIGTDAPHRCPLSDNLVCVSATPIEGKGRAVLNTDGMPDFENGAKIRAHYRSAGVAFGGSFSDTALDDPGNAHQIDPTTPIVWCTQELDFANETLGVPNTGYTWYSDGAAASIPVQVDIPVTTLVLTFHRRSALPMTTVRALRGCINLNTFLGAPPETVWFRGAKTTREASTDGSVTQKVQMTFMERDVSWNKFLRPGKMPTGTTTATWDYLVDAGGLLRLSKQDLAPLIQIP